MSRKGRFRGASAAPMPRSIPTHGRRLVSARSIRAGRPSASRQEIQGSADPKCSRKTFGNGPQGSKVYKGQLGHADESKHLCPGHRGRLDCCAIETYLDHDGPVSGVRCSQQPPDSAFLHRRPVE